jgi:hypothetical protein
VAQVGLRDAAAHHHGRERRIERVDESGEFAWVGFRFALQDCDELSRAAGSVRSPVASHGSSMGRAHGQGVSQGGGMVIFKAQDWQTHARAHSSLA